MRLERAIAFAAKAHAGQLDELDHCKRVMGVVSEPAKRVAVLHDVVQDTDQSLESVDAACDLSHPEMVALGWLTCGDSTYGEYIGQLASAAGMAGELAREVKVADLRDNLARWTPELGDDLRRRYERALARLTEGNG
jgi:hypothetical protein